MGKKKSMTLIILLSIVMVILLLLSTVSCTIPFTNGVKEYNSILSNVNLGMDVNGGTYAVIYPEGVISVAEYNDMEDETEKAKYEAYEGNSAIYMQRDTLTDSFKESFQEAVDVLTYRVESKHLAGASVCVENDYTIRVTAPYGDSNAAAIAGQLSYSGDFTLSYGNKTYIKNNHNHDISDYIKSAGALENAGSYLVEIKLTKDGRAKIKEASALAAASDSDSALVFAMGDNQIVSLTVEEEIDNSSLYISGYTDLQTAENVAILIQSAVEEKILNLDFTVGDVRSYEPANSELTKTLIVLAIALIVTLEILLTALVFKGLSVVNAYALVTYGLAMLITVAIAGWTLTLGGVIMAVLGGLILSAVNVFVFHTMQKEFYKGRTIAAAVKSAYKRTLLSIVDLHVVLFIVALVVFLIAVGAVKTMALVAMVAVAYSFIGYWLTRFYWYMIMPQAKDQYTFCNVVREK